MSNPIFEIDIQATVTINDAWRSLIETAVFTTLIAENVSSPASLTLVLSDDAHLQQLNQQFRQQNKPTDILSFPAVATVGMESYLGDIVISVAYAQRHAQHDGHTLAEELQLLAVHGTLHLLGYDDTEPAAKREMWAVQTAVLKTLNLNLNLPEA